MKTNLLYMKMLFDGMIRKGVVEEFYIERPFTTQLFFSRLSYFPEAFIYRLVDALGAHRKKFYSCKSAQSLIVEFDNFVIVTFRGTQVRQLADWSTILNFRLEEYHDVEAHKGFVDSLNLLKQPMLDDIGRFDCLNKKVVYAGHSMGGALATLFSIDHPADEITTFGSPMVSSGDRFMNHYRFIKYNRLITKHDFVHLLPIKWPWRYQHIGKEIKLPSKATFKNPFKSHSLDSYLSGLLDQRYPVW